MDGCEGLLFSPGFGVQGLGLPWLVKFRSGRHSAFFGWSAVGA